VIAKKQRRERRWKEEELDYHQNNTGAAPGLEGGLLRVRQGRAQSNRQKKKKTKKKSEIADFARVLDALRFVTLNQKRFCERKRNRPPLSLSKDYLRYKRDGCCWLVAGGDGQY